MGEGIAGRDHFGRFRKTSPQSRRWARLWAVTAPLFGIAGGLLIFVVVSIMLGGCGGLNASTQLFSSAAILVWATKPPQRQLWRIGLM
jgi:hypothetical protein